MKVNKFYNLIKRNFAYLGADVFNYLSLNLCNLI